MRLGMTEGCPTCVSMQTCVRCKCGGEVTAPPNPSLFNHDLDTEAQFTNDTPSDMERDFLAPAQSMPGMPETYESAQEYEPSTPLYPMVEEQAVDEMEAGDEGAAKEVEAMEGLGEYADMGVSGWVAASGAAIVGISFLLGKSPAQEVVRGVGIVVGGFGLGSLISNAIATAKA